MISISVILQNMLVHEVANRFFQTQHFICTGRVISDTYILRVSAKERRPFDRQVTGRLGSPLTALRAERADDDNRVASAAAARRLLGTVATTRLIIVCCGCKGTYSRWRRRVQYQRRRVPPRRAAASPGDLPVTLRTQLVIGDSDLQSNRDLLISAVLAA